MCISEVKAFKYVYIWLIFKPQKLYVNTSILNKETQ